MQAAAVITGIIGSLVNLIVALLLFVAAALVERLVDEVGVLEGLTDLDEIAIAILIVLGVIWLIFAILGIVGASLAVKKPTGAFVLLILATSFTFLVFLLSLQSGEWRVFLPYLLATLLLVSSTVLTFLGRRQARSQSL